MLTAKEKVQEKLQTLRDQARHHDYCHYVRSTPEITDKQYDDLMQEIDRIEAQKLGIKIVCEHEFINVIR